MDPSAQFCPSFYCLHRGEAGQGNIRVHSRAERRFRCNTCGKTFAATTNTPYYRLHKSLDLVTLFLTPLTYGCPRQAVVAAHGLDERTVADWQHKAGRHSQRFHQLHVQADEMWVKALGRKLWVATALAVLSRLWLGGAFSRHRDGKLIAAVVRMVRSCARSLAVLVCVDGSQTKRPRQAWGLTGSRATGWRSASGRGSAVARLPPFRLLWGVGPVHQIRPVVAGQGDGPPEVLVTTRAGAEVARRSPERVGQPAGVVTGRAGRLRLAAGKRYTAHR
jgi:transposase-like protein